MPNVLRVDTDQVTRGKPAGIGGWLLLSLVLLILSLVTMTINLAAGQFGAFDVTARVMADSLPSRSFGATLHNVLGTAVLVAGAVLYLLGLFSLVQFLQRRKEAARLMVVFYGFVSAIALLTAIRLVNYSYIFWSVIGSVPSTIRLTLLPVIQLAIASVWILYYRRSKRVQHTFVR
jgi:hypothetical protein